jgi:hypothetical protein
MTKFFISTSSFDELIVTLKPRPGDKEITANRAYELFYFHGQPEFTEDAALALLNPALPQEPTSPPNQP